MLQKSGSTVGDESGSTVGDESGSTVGDESSSTVGDGPPSKKHGWDKMVEAYDGEFSLYSCAAGHIHHSPSSTLI